MALKDDDDETTEGEVVAVEGEAAADEGEAVAVEQQKGQANQSDERMAQSDETDEDEGTSATDAEREARRLERRARKERERAAKERNRRELEFLRKRNEALERRFSQYEQRQVRSEAAILDDRVAQIEQHIQKAEEIHAMAVSQAKGEDASEALRIRDDLREQKRALLGQKQAIARAAQEQSQRPVVETVPDSQPEVPAELIAHARDWQSKNPWYKPDRSDQDSVIAGAIDDRLVAEGFDPETEEYWDELSNRVRKALPHRFKQDSRQNGGPALANGGRSERSLRPGEVYVSPERKQAMIEAGVWEDPKLRQRYLKQYQKYDQEHGRSRA